MPDQQAIIEVEQDARPLIPEWTYEDFTEETPYQWLYQYIENTWVLNQMLSKVQKRAKEVKFPAFNRMWSSYVQAQKPQSATVVGEYQTMFDGQPAQLNCKQYICDNDGIAYIGSMGQGVEVLSHPLMPIKRVINLDSHEEKLEIAFTRGGGKWRTLIESKDVLASSQRIISLAKKGIAVNSENARDLVTYITKLESSNYNDLEQQNSTSHLGWLPENQFAPYCEKVVYDGDSTEFKKMFEGFKPTGDEDVWMNIAKAARAGRSVPARIALAASFAAPLIKIMNALPFFVHIWGTQGCGKTVGLMLAASVWGDPEVGHYIKTFGGTKTSFEFYASFCGNVPVILDELQIISDRKTFDDIIYMLCEGTSKGRGSKDGGLQLQRHWANTIITSAEMPIVQSNSGGGAAARCIEVNYGGEPLFPDSRSVAETLKQNYGFAGKKFIQALQVENAIESLRAVQHKYYNELMNGDIQDKQVLSASILLAADKLADLAIFHDGKALTVRDIRPYLITRDQADVNARCYDWLCGYIASNPARFSEEDSNGGRWGEIKEESGRDVAFIIKSSFDTMLASGGFSTGSFLTWAKRKGLLKQNPSRPDKLTVQRRFLMPGDNKKSMVTCVGVILPEPEDDPSGGLPEGFTRIEEQEDLPF